MIDVGSEKFYRHTLRSILRKWGAEVEMLALSHPDGNHVGGAHLLMQQGDLRNAIIPTMKAQSPSYRDFISGAEDHGCEILVGTRGERYQLGGDVWLEVIREGLPEDRGIADNRTMVMRVHWKGWRVLLLGDLGLEDELALLEGEYDLAADVILLGRHHHGNSINMPFLKATGAKAVITSAANYPPFEKPPQNWIQTMERNGIEIFNQAETGAVLMDFGENDLELRAFLQEEKKLILER